MKFFIQWAAALSLAGICLVPAYLGLQFTRYLEYLALTFLCAGTMLIILRLANRPAPEVPNISNPKEKAT